ncbi:hypothetical protein CSUI_000149 [Cystoisospora suis]|uniref:Uncharacterized protein n=1 Tax=Cystoisospora suis TaxID=483139 RepID=A0A2C6L220_9APIC|nr:hypothetical protein CSUI_000149 [Cystoisospora suis]
MCIVVDQKFSSHFARFLPDVCFSLGSNATRNVSFKACNVAALVWVRERETDTGYCSVPLLDCVDTCGDTCVQRSYDFSFLLWDVPLSCCSSASEIVHARG